jgi:hypothetical protein
MLFEVPNEEAIRDLAFMAGFGYFLDLSFHLVTPMVVMLKHIDEMPTICSGLKKEPSLFLFLFPYTPFRLYLHPILILDLNLLLLNILNIHRILPVCSESCIHSNQPVSSRPYSVIVNFGLNFSLPPHC